MDVGEGLQVDIAAGGDPVAALAAQTEKYAVLGQVLSVGVAHDEECPCVPGAPMAQCTCEIIELTVRRMA